MTPPDRHFSYGDYLHHGMQFGLILVVFLLAGWWLDSKFHWSPVCTISGVFLGAAAGLYSLYQHLFGQSRPPADSE